MKVYALVGKSGTGKSHHSMWVAKENKIDYIIDDGLLISDNRIIAGKSAKREPTKVASVRCAVFSDEKYASRVKEAIQSENVQSILIIGTSEKMVSMIAAALELGPVEKIIRIEDVSTPEEMQIASEMRNKEGKHVIPVPTFEVKKQFSGYFVDPLMLLFKKKGQTVVEEKTVMRPSYSYLGEYKIAPKVLADICIYEASRFPSVHKIQHFRQSTSPGGRLILEMDISVNYPCRVSRQAKKIAEKIKESIETFTSINVKKVSINVKTLHIVKRGER